jgi:chitodextrinase
VIVERGTLAAENRTTITVSTATDTTPPTVPTGLTATAISSSQINLSWTASTDNVGVTGYRIYRGGTQIGTSNTNSYQDTGLAANTTYSYTVAAYDSAGNISGQSATASATTLTAGLPIGNTSPKKGVGYSGGTLDQMRALGVSWAYNWSASSPELFNQNVFQYVPMIFGAGENSDRSYSQSELTNYADIARAHPGSYWLIWNEPDYYQQSNIPADVAARIYKPLYDAIKGADPTAKLIVGGILYQDTTWLTDFRNNYKSLYGQYPPLDGYHMHNYMGRTDYNTNTWRNYLSAIHNWMNSNGEGTKELWLTEFPCLNCYTNLDTIMAEQIPWLEQQSWLTRYAWFATYAGNFSGTLLTTDGGLTDLGKLYATYGNPPAATLYVSLSATPSSSFDLTATVSGTAQGTINYTFYCNRSDSGTNITTPYDAKYDNQLVTTYTARAVCKYSSTGTYIAKVIAERGTLQAEARTIITVSNPPVSDTQPPSSPTNPIATAVSSFQIDLSWTASTDNVGVTGYRIYRCQGAGCTPTTQISTSGTNSYSDTGLTANTTYVYRVAAYDEAGNLSGQSNSTLAKTQALPAKKGDSNNDGKVDIIDLGIFLSNWGKTSKPPADINQDGKVDIIDLGILLSNWG